jgi:hypothetical protein
MRCVLWAALSIAAVFSAGVTGCNQAGDPPSGNNSHDELPRVGPSVGATADTAAQVGGTPLAEPADVGEWIIGEPIRHANLTVFPVSSRVLKNEDRFITLDAGLKAGTVEVMEIGAAAGPAGAGSSDIGSSEIGPSGVRPAAVTVATATPTGSTVSVVARPTPQATAQAAAPIPTTAGASGPVNPFGGPAADVTGNSVGPVVVNPFAGEPDLRNFTVGPQVEVQGIVNQLVVVNRSGKPLYLMPGEIVIGGKQDRAVGGEYVIAPDGKPTNIDAFCVQQGRWGEYPVDDLALVVKTANGSAKFGGSTTVLGGDKADLNALAAKTGLGQFVGSVGNVSKQTRLAVQSAKNQGTVWQEVGTANAGNGAARDSVTFSGGTFTGNYILEDATRPLEAYLDALTKPVADRPNVVGVIVAVNGKVETADVFESTPLFKQLWPKLLKSYALDASQARVESPDPAPAIAAGTAAAGAPPECNREDARAFLVKTVEGKTTKTESTGDVVTTTVTSDDVISFSAHHRGQAGPSAAAPSAGSGGGLGGGGSGAVHVGGFAF